MTLAEYIPESGTDHSLTVVNRTAPKPLQAMLEEVFTRQPVSIEESALPGEDEDLVLLTEEGSVVAVSPLDALQECILMVNSDLYITGARGIDELDLPAVIEGLDDVPFSLRGYPASHNEKLLLITISRYIERLAWQAGSGTLRSGFQYLSRVDDEQGTRRVYERVVEAGVDTHVYGVPDREVPASLGVTVHGAHTEEFRKSWFVVCRPADETERCGALVAYENDAGGWDGFWTYRRGLVAAIDGYIERRM